MYRIVHWCVDSFGTIYIHIYTYIRMTMTLMTTLMRKVDDNTTDAMTTSRRSIERPWRGSCFLLLAMMILVVVAGDCSTHTAVAWTTTTTTTTTLPPRFWTHGSSHRRHGSSSSSSSSSWSRCHLLPPRPPNDDDNDASFTTTATSTPAATATATTATATTTTSSSSYRYDGTTEEGWIAHAKYFIQQTDRGLLDPSILLDDDDDDDTESSNNHNNNPPPRQRFQCIQAPLQVPLSKREYLAAGRYFHLRHAFPDYDDRPYDFRIVVHNKNNHQNQNTNDDIVTIRCTCRRIGTMRGTLRLRNQVVCPPTEQTLISPPEAWTLSFDRTTGRLVQFVTGFVLDRLVGNTRGTTGVVAASVIAGEDVSMWDWLPPVTILGRFTRPVPPIPEYSSSSSLPPPPFPASVLIQLAKGILSSRMAYNDPTLLSDTSFSYSTPMVGPITKNNFVKSYALQEFPAPLQPMFDHFRVDPYDPYRVWVDVVLTVPTENFTSPPQAMSFRFDDQGYCTRITSQAVMDPTSFPTAGGLGGYDGYLYHMGRGRPGMYTRPLTQSIERWRRRCLTPLTGIQVDDYNQLPAATPSRRNRLEQLFSKMTTTTKKTPQPPSTPPPAVVVESNEVVQRLARLKEFTSSIRIIPPSSSSSVCSKNPDSITTSTTRTVQERLAQATKATQQSKLKIEQAKREAAALQQNIARAKINASAPPKKQQPETWRAKPQQQQQQSTTPQKTAANVARPAAARSKEQRTLEERQKQEEKTRQQQQQQQQQVAAARLKEQRALEQRRKQEESERQKRASQEAKQAAALTKERLAAAKARTRPSSTLPTKSNVSVRSVNNDRDAAPMPSFDGLARATISLFGLGKSELEELPAPTVKSSSSSQSRRRRAPLGVPTVTRWRKNSDRTITGLVQGSRNFDNGSRITTSPITSGTIASGEVIRTGSGSRYFLE